MLKILTFETVRLRVSQFSAYLDTIRVSAAEEKVLLLQHLEGSPLTFVEGFGEQSSETECLGGLMAYAKPSWATIMRKLFYLKKNPKESIVAFVIRFNNVVVGAGVREERLKDAGMGHSCF